MVERERRKGQKQTTCLPRVLRPGKIECREFPKAGEEKKTFKLVLHLRRREQGGPCLSPGTALEHGEIESYQGGAGKG